MTDQTEVNPYEGKMHPVDTLIVLTLLLGPVVGAILFAQNLHTLGKKRTMLVTVGSWIVLVVELVLTLKYHFSDTGILWASVGLVYIAVIMMITTTKQEQKYMSKLKKYAPAVKPVLYGIGLELIAVLVAVLLK